MKWLSVVLCWLAAAGIFYSMFFKLAPYVCTLIPAGQWQGFMKVAVYFAVAYLGGLGIPLILIFYSSIILWKAKNFDNF
ncbi:MAG: hypothetical protein LHV68_12995 [Elusimicrobia bacterium]|nr:hypothetical protein [Candidatus Liberimonas magnetica]